MLKLLLAFLVAVPTCQSQNGLLGWNDRFTYNDESIERSDGFFDWAPQNWNEIKCDEKRNLDQCLAYIDKWEVGRDCK